MKSPDSLHRKGLDRLYPALTNPNWLVLGRRREIFRQWIDSIPGEHLKVLDVGGRIQPYLPLFKGRVAQYWAVDLIEDLLVNVVGRAEAIPFRTGVFDVVICTQVLQYIEQPQAMIAEIIRVMKPGGLLLLSAPAVFPRDSEADLWRFMPGSLQLLLKDFNSVRVLAEGSSVAGLFRVLALYTFMFPRPALLRKLLRITLIPILNLIGAAFESLLTAGNDQFSANFSVLAKK